MPLFYADNPLNVTGSVGITTQGNAISITTTGSLVTTGSVGVYQISNPWMVSATGAFVVTGALGVNNLVAVTASTTPATPFFVSASNSPATPLWITGSVFQLGSNQITVTSTGALLVTGTFGSSTTPIWVTNTGSQVITGSVGVNNLVNVTASTNISTPFWVTGTVTTQGGSAGAQYGSGTTNTGAPGFTGTLVMGQFSGATNFQALPLRVDSLGQQFITNTGSLVITGSVGVNNLVAVTASTNAATPLWITGSVVQINTAPIAVTNTGSLVVTGSVGVNNIVQVTGSAFGGAATPIWVTTTGTIPVREIRSATATITSPSATNTTSVILASNANRIGATIFNEGTATVYLAFAATASTTAYTVRVSQNAFFEVPGDYTGVISGITSTGTGQCRVTELT